LKDTQLYQQLLGIAAPWSVNRVALQVSQATVDVWLEHPADQGFECPQCGHDLSVYDHAVERTWRHLDSCQFKTLVHAAIPRVSCPKHGVRQVAVPWAEPNSRFTMLFERLAIDLLRECSINGAAKILRLSWDEAHGIMARAVQRGLLRKDERNVEYIGVDEKSFRKRHRYVTVVCNLRAGTIEYAAPERTKQALDNYYKTLDYEQLSSIPGIAMDMWHPFKAATEEHVPEGDSKIVFDRFHMMKHMVEAVDLVRRLRQLWACADWPSAGRFWRGWFVWATHSRLPSVRDVAYMVKRHLPNVLSQTSSPVSPYRLRVQ
jgi:transposase